MSKLLVVFGATGQQGGSVIQYVLNDDELSRKYRLRGITRDPSKPAAIALKEKGVEVVQADLNDPSSLSRAVEGAYAVFSVTNFFDSGSGSVETAQGKAVADAALAAGVTLMIWSSLPNVTKMTHGEVTHLHHFDSKAAVEEYIRSLGFPISVFFYAGGYMQNISHPMLPKAQLQSDGTVIYPFAWPPSMQLPWIDITDTGKYVAPALREPEKYNGKHFTGATANYTAQEIVDTWSKVSGRKVRLITDDEVAQYVTNPMQQMVVRPGLFFTKYGYFGPDGQQDIEWTHAQLHSKDKLTTWEEFLVRQGPWFVE